MSYLFDSIRSERKKSAESEFVQFSNMVVSLTSYLCGLGSEERSEFGSEISATSCDEHTCTKIHLQPAVILSFERNSEVLGNVRNSY